MKKVRELTFIILALLLVHASWTFAQSQQMERREERPAPIIIFKSEMPPPLASDVQSEKINRKPGGHLEEYQEKDQGVPTAVEPDTTKSDKVNRRTAERVKKNRIQKSDKMDPRSNEGVKKSSPLKPASDLLSPREFY